MTTIAWDGKTLAVDRAGWGGASNQVWVEVDKLHSVCMVQSIAERWDLPISYLPPNAKVFTEEIVWASCGGEVQIAAIKRYMEVDDAPPPTLPADQAYGLLMIVRGDTNQVCGLYTHYGTEVMPVYGAPIAMGGGHEMALGAMLAGASAKRAIELVASRSGWSAGGVDSFTVGEGYDWVRWR